MAKSKRKKHPWRPKPPTGPIDTRSLDAFKQLAADTEAELRVLKWRQADQVLELIHELTALGFGHYAAAQLIGEAAGYENGWARILEKIAVTFPEPSRMPGVDMGVHRAALRSRDPWATVEYAAKNKLNANQLRAWIDKNEPETKRGRRANVRVAGVMRQTEGDIIITPENGNAVELAEGAEVSVVITQKQKTRA